MAKTFYDSLQKASITAETFHGSVGLDIFHDEVSEDSKRELKEIEARELKILKKRIIETHANNHQSIANVVDGSTTFYSYGEPIIEQAKRVEDKYRGRNFGLAKKSDFLGEDARDPADVQEVVQYLRREEIINPNKFFRSKLILPQSARKIAGKWNESHKLAGGGDRSLAFIGTLFATGAVGAGIGYLGHGLAGAIGGFFGGYGLAGAAILLPPGLEGATLERVSEQRISFEQALNTLDSEVREHFPLDHKLKVVGAA